MKIKRLENNNNPLPSKATTYSAGYDLMARSGGSLRPGDRILVQTGFAMEIPVNYVGLICPRSGLALKHGVTVLNAPGIIDSDYRGDLGVILINHGAEPFVFKTGERVAQLLITQMAPVSLFQEVDELDDTDRGDGGFGHSGR